jgi:hypothetical protein
MVIMHHCIEFHKISPHSQASSKVLAVFFSITEIQILSLISMGKSPIRVDLEAVIINNAVGLQSYNEQDFCFKQVDTQR